MFDAELFVSACQAALTTADPLNAVRTIVSKAIGDGFVATFEGPGRGIQCACAIRDALKTLDIDVRAGLHIGEIEVRGDDVAGIAVHLAQRVSGLAPAGEVLVSRTVTDLVAGSGLVFEDRGEHELKGVPGVWHLYSVVA